MIFHYFFTWNQSFYCEIFNLGLCLNYGSFKCPRKKYFFLEMEDFSVKYSILNFFQSSSWIIQRSKQKYFPCETTDFSLKWALAPCTESWLCYILDYPLETFLEKWMWMHQHRCGYCQLLHTKNTHSVLQMETEWRDWVRKFVVFPKFGIQGQNSEAHNPKATKLLKHHWYKMPNSWCNTWT